MDTKLFPVLALLAAAACGDAGEAPGAGDGGDASDAGEAGTPGLLVEAIASPAPAGSAEPNVTAGPDGLYLTWLEPAGQGHALRFARLEPGADGWGPARTIIEREGMLANWADFPSLLVLDDGALAAHWLVKSGANPHAYDIHAAVSTDGGETWSDALVVHRDGLEAEHGFVSMFPVRRSSAADGVRFGAAWLDGRETVRGGPMTLRYATLGPDGPSEEAVLDASVCDCCQTGAAVAADGPIVVYRDRTEGEVRDVKAIRRTAAGWSDPASVHDDGWVINGCPVNGPAVAADGERVVVAWFTAAPDARVLAAFSDDAGASFGAPIRIDDGAAQGRVAVVLLDDGDALVSWLERSEGDAEIRLRRVAPDGAAGAGSDPPTTAGAPLAATSAERASGFPRMARHGDRILFAWTEAGAPSRVRTAVGRVGDGSTAEATLSPDAPAFEAITLDGDSVALADLRGAPVLLNVWATWCAPCRREIPELQELHEEFGPALRVVGVTVDARSAGEDVRAFIDEHGMTYDVWWDPDQVSVSRFEAVGVPLTVLIGPDGKIRWRHLGALEPDDPSLREAVEAVL